ncbi:major facilitator superfamily domain-containing protein [Xylariaceae sp. FL1651]|nr:major facilitator superfamily domain-containing protein [Xylariaceae sp. FL1651]
MHVMDRSPEQCVSKEESDAPGYKDRSTLTDNGSSATYPPPPYSSFSKRQKRGIVALVAFAGWFSSLSSFIYFPAIPFMAVDLGVSVEMINLTVTAYLIASGIFPSLVGEAADTIGRRPVLIFTLFFYVVANIGLALQSSFGLLFFLRIVQSAGISGSYAVTYGVIGDLFTPAERGGYSGVVSFVLNTPPSIGPVISGLLMEKWGWRAIFWFLAAISPCCLVSVIIFLPETSRNLVGNGSKIPKRANRVLVSFLVPEKQYEEEPSVLIPTSRGFYFPNPLKPLTLLGKPNTAIVVGSVGVWYTIYSCLQASLSSLFTQIYQVSGLVSGLTYIPFGVACAISAFGTGKILDIDYRHTAAKYSLSFEKSRNYDLDSFPIEEARLRSLKYSLLLCGLLVAGYGWLLQCHVNITAALVFQFFIGLSMQCVFTALSTLLVDIHPDASSTAQAASNFIRAELAAAGLAILDLILQKLGAGWTFVLFAIVGLLSIPWLYLLQIKGLRWRQRN